MNSSTNKLETKNYSLEDLGYPPGHFYSPLVDVYDPLVIKAVSDRIKTPLPNGITFDHQNMIRLMEKLSKHLHLFPFPRHKSPSWRFYFDNPYFACHDASVYFSMIMEYRPHRVIEVGCGFSSSLLLDTNDAFFNGAIHTTFIDPYLCSTDSRFEPCNTLNAILLPIQIQKAPFELFESLRENDILFVDSSHVCKTGSDVNYYLFEILPRLEPGVLIHIHDIMYPFEYPANMVLKEKRNWNEAYALKAFLQYNETFNLIYWVNYAWHHCSQYLKELMPLCLENEGGSIWLMKCK